MVLPRREVVHLSEAVHGTVDHAELGARGIDSRTVIDFSASVNPFGPTPSALAALQKLSLHEYPDRDCAKLRHALANLLDTSPDCLLAGNGSGELLLWIGLAFLRPADKVLVIGPTYAEYARVAAIMGAEVVHCDAAAETGFAVPLDRIARSVREHQPRILFLCNPNNPTGQAVPVQVLEGWAKEFCETLVVVDEAYIELAGGLSSLVGSSIRNIAVLRSLTKAHGLAGLRLGYLVADPDVVRSLCHVRPPWTVSVAAQEAGRAAIEDAAYLRSTCQRLAEGKRQLFDALETLRLPPIPSAAAFFLVHVKGAANVRNALLEDRVLVRDCSSFGLPNHIRVSPRSLEDNRILVRALTRVVCPALLPT